MATFITLINYTDQGIRDVKDSPSRLDSVKELIRGLGGEMTHFYLTMGTYDLVAISELPADESAVPHPLGESAVSATLRPHKGTLLDGLFDRRGRPQIAHDAPCWRSNSDSPRSMAARKTSLVVVRPPER